MRAMYRNLLDRLIGFDGDGDPAQAVAALDPNQLSPANVAAWAREVTQMANTRPEQQRRKAERLAKLTTISEGDYQNTINDVIDVTFSFIPADRRSFAAETLRAYLDGDLDMNKFRKPRP